MKKLLPHQSKAVKAVVKEFETADRTHIVMACGTGKTFAALKIAEAMKPKSMVVFLPSLALVNQFMKEWISETKLKNLSILTICCDDTVTDGIEADSLLYEEVDFPVSNDIGDIKSFIKLKSVNTKLIFCTYQSSHLLAEASKRQSFDLAIFDEAHKTAGYEKVKFSCALGDAHIKIKKRLFMTATPRHAHAVKRDKGGEPVPIFSMDNEDLYGRRSYTLGFREAINLGLICDYKIIIAISRKGKDIHKDGRAVALKKAIIQSDSKKIVTYHRSINDAYSFCDFTKNNKLIKGHTSLCISGKLDIKDRSKIMQKFKDSKQAIISNSRCLTEGIDVPAIDMVAFLNQKSSKVDIVQAIGRALRRNGDKKLGYIFLPVFVDNENGDHAAEIERSEFRHIWEVLNALSEQDSDLNDVIREISRKKGESGSRPVDYSELTKFIDSVDIDLDDLDHIRTKILEKQCLTWDVRYGELRAWKERNGNCRVPYDRNVDTEYRSLAHWVRQQRDYKKNKFLSQYKQDLLNKLDFDWDPGDDAWKENYDVAVKFYKKNGHIHIPHSRHSDKETLRLSKWINAQRRRVHGGTMPPDRAALLKKIDFDFSPLNQVIGWFESGYPKLIEHIQTNGKRYTQLGGIDVTTSPYLKGFIGAARAKYKLGELSPEQIRLLEDIPIVWDPDETTWQKFFDEYCDAIKHKRPLKHLTSWICVQRSNYKRRKLRLDRLKKLKDIGFVFTESRVIERGEHMKTYLHYKKNGIPITFSNPETENLAKWASGLKSKRRQGRLGAETIQKLNEAGFDWD